MWKCTALLLGLLAHHSLAECPNEADYELRVYLLNGKVPSMDGILYGDTDAYVKFWVDGEYRMSEWDESLTPEWNEWINFGCVNHSATMWVQVWDFDTLGDDEFVFGTSWSDWSTYLEGVNKRLFSTDDDNDKYWIDLRVNYTNFTQEKGGMPTATPTHIPEPTMAVTYPPTLLQRWCEDDYVPNCDMSGDCCSAYWIGDGIRDCPDQAHGCDLSCYDADGGDCAPTMSPTLSSSPTTPAPSHRPTHRPTHRPSSMPTGAHHSSNDDDGMSAGAVTGVVFGVLIGVAVLAFVGYKFYKSRGSAPSYNKFGGSEMGGFGGSSRTASPMHDDEPSPAPTRGSGYQPPLLGNDASL